MFIIISAYFCGMERVLMREFSQIRCPCGYLPNRVHLSTRLCVRNENLHCFLRIVKCQVVNLCNSIKISPNTQYWSFTKKNNYIYLLSFLSFTIFILYPPYPLSSLSLTSSSFILLILCYPLPLQSFSFINLIFYHPDPLAFSNSSLSISFMIRLMFIILIILIILQDVLDGCAAAGIGPGTFSPGVFWRARAPKNAPPTRQNFEAGTIPAKVSQKPKKNEKKNIQAEKTKNNFWQNGVNIKFILYYQDLYRICI